MHSSSHGAARAGRLVLPALLGAAMLAACADAPTATRDLVPANALAAFDCHASVTGESVRCNPVAPGAGGALGSLMGGQNTYVTLSSTNFNYNPVAGEFSFDVTVQNLMNEAMGTSDGVTPAALGIMVFFLEDPATTGGTGNVSVMEPTGTAFFTAADQAYHTYNDVLDKDEVSSVKTWKFSVDPGVTNFYFRVLIETEMQYKLVINEMLVNPGGVITDASGEWIEIYNAGTLAVDMQNLVIADSAASGRRPYHLIASSLPVPAGGYVVLGNTTNTTNNGGVPVDYAYGGAMAFANSLDAFKIARVVGTDTLTLDRTQYASAAISAVNGVSRELLNPALDNSNMDGSNWGDALVTAVYGPGGRGTPKAQNSTFTP